MTALHPQRHDPPRGWALDTFDRVTDALAAALVASYRRTQRIEELKDGTS